jgi:hypothetical protein
MAVDGNSNPKDPEKLLDKRKKINNFALGHIMGIPGSKVADKEAKTALNDRLLPTEKYPPQDFINWIKMEWTINGKTVKTFIGRKKEIEWNNNTRDIKRKDQMVISRLRTG